MACLEHMFVRALEEVGFFLEDLVMTWLAIFFLVFKALDYYLSGDYLVDVV